MMMTGISSAQNARAVMRRRSFIGMGATDGSEMLRTCKRQAMTSPKPMIKPGTMPDTNKAEIDVLVVTP